MAATTNRFPITRMITVPNAPGRRKGLTYHEIPRGQALLAAAFKGGGETITLTHTARDRSIFARGALEAARWVHGRQGWFTMKDVLGF